MRDHVSLLINGQPHKVAAPDTFQPLSTFLRERLGLTGTKVVCAEGDCGSCTVLLGRIRNNKLSYQPVCSCIQSVFQMDGAHVVTVEGLSYGGQLNPVQTAMVKHHGAQCGYCTPGFVVAMCSVLDETKTSGVATKEHDLRRGLVGNLCRCTGYESILQAGLSVDRAALRALNDLYVTPAIAQALSQADREPLEIRHENTLFSKPTNLADALAFRAANPKCTILSGGTDIGVQSNKGIRQLQTVLSTTGLRDLESITVANNQITAGARASLSDLEKITLQHLPEFGKMLAWFGSPLIKNAGTIGGNIANGSPIGDTMPALFVLNAQVELTGPAGPRRININDFYTGYRTTIMRPEELITAVIIPLPAPTDLFKIYKISKRKDLDISTFMAAIWLQNTQNRTRSVSEGRPVDPTPRNLAHTLAPQNRTRSVSEGGETSRNTSDLPPTINTARIAFGGVAPTIVRLPKTESFLRNQPFSEFTFKQAGAIARHEIHPISDVRGAADYRLQLAENILCKFHADTAPYQKTPANAASNGAP